jgi:hypothetical protein
MKHDCNGGDVLAQVLQDGVTKKGLPLWQALLRFTFCVCVFAYRQRNSGEYTQPVTLPR